MRQSIEGSSQTGVAVANGFHARGGLDVSLSLGRVLPANGAAVPLNPDQMTPGQVLEALREINSGIVTGAEPWKNLGTPLGKDWIALNRAVTAGQYWGPPDVGLSPVERANKAIQR